MHRILIYKTEINKSLVGNDCLSFILNFLLRFNIFLLLTKRSAAKMISTFYGFLFLDFLVIILCIFSTWILAWCFFAKVFSQYSHLIALSEWIVWWLCRSCKYVYSLRQIEHLYFLLLALSLCICSCFALEDLLKTILQIPHVHFSWTIWWVLRFFCAL